MRFLAFLILITSSCIALAKKPIALSDTTSYPQHSNEALGAVKQDLTELKISLESLYFEAKCNIKSCSITVAKLTYFQLEDGFRGCNDLCIHYGYNNEHSYIVKKAHIR